MLNDNPSQINQPKISLDIFTRDPAAKALLQKFLSIEDLSNPMPPKQREAIMVLYKKKLRAQECLKIIYGETTAKEVADQLKNGRDFISQLDNFLISKNCNGIVNTSQLTCEYWIGFVNNALNLFEIYYGIFISDTLPIRNELEKLIGKPLSLNEKQILYSVLDNALSLSEKYSSLFPKKLFENLEDFSDKVINEYSISFSATILIARSIDRLKKSMHKKQVQEVLSSLSKGEIMFDYLYQHPEEDSHFERLFDEYKAILDEKMQVGDIPLESFYKLSLSDDSPGLSTKSEQKPLWTDVVKKNLPPLTEKNKGKLSFCILSFGNDASPHPPANVKPVVKVPQPQKQTSKLVRSQSMTKLGPVPFQGSAISKPSSQLPRAQSMSNLSGKLGNGDRPGVLERVRTGVKTVLQKALPANWRLPENPFRNLNVDSIQEEEETDMPTSSLHATVAQGATENKAKRKKKKKSVKKTIQETTNEEAILNITIKENAKWQREIPEENNSEQFLKEVKVFLSKDPANNDSGTLEQCAQVLQKADLFLMRFKNIQQSPKNKKKINETKRELISYKTSIIKMYKLILEKGITLLYESSSEKMVEGWRNLIGLIEILQKYEVLGLCLPNNVTVIDYCTQLSIALEKFEKKYFIKYKKELTMVEVTDRAFVEYVCSRGLIVSFLCDNPKEALYRSATYPNFIKEGWNILNESNYSLIMSKRILSYFPSNADPNKLVFTNTVGDNVNIIYFACKGKSTLEFLRLLLEDSRVNLNAPCHQNSWTPLMCASVNSNIEAVKLLLEKGADLDFQFKQVTTQPILFYFFLDTFWNSEEKEKEKEEELDIIRLLVEHQKTEFNMIFFKQILNSKKTIFKQVFLQECEKLSEDKRKEKGITGDFIEQLRQSLSSVVSGQVASVLSMNTLLNESLEKAKTFLDTCKDSKGYSCPPMQCDVTPLLFNSAINCSHDDKYSEVPVSIRKEKVRKEKNNIS